MQRQYKETVSYQIDQIVRQAKEDVEQAGYEEAYNRIEAQIVAENVADGADEATFKADGAQVHQRVMKELSERKHCED